MRIDWQHPVWKGERRESASGSVSVEAKHALSAEDAYAYLAGDDPRPLLVLRECLTCTGTDDALLTRQADNEKTMLMSRWFHCVKLPPDVLEEDHPFHALFDGDEPCHLFLANRGGDERAELQGDQSRSELWGVMEAALEANYAQSHEKALKELFRVLDGFDRVDARISEREVALDDVVEDKGPDSSKAKKIKAELTKLRNERNALLEKLDKVSRLEMREQK